MIALPLILDCVCQFARESRRKSKSLHLLPIQKSDGNSFFNLGYRIFSSRKLFEQLEYLGCDRRVSFAESSQMRHLWME